jgi:hypothetical protein
VEAGESNGVRFVQMRANLISAVRFLANSPTEWKHVRYDEGGTLVSFIDFDMAINILFHDVSDLESDPRAQIGYALANETEADAMQRLVRALDIVLDVDYPDDLDEDYVKTPRWLDVVETAREALRIINATEHRM